MPRLGYTDTQGRDGQSVLVAANRAIGVAIRVPVDGWVNGFGYWAGSGTTNGTVTLLFDERRNLVTRGARVTASGSFIYTSLSPALSLRAAAGERVHPAIYSFDGTLRLRASDSENVFNHSVPATPTVQSAELRRELVRVGNVSSGIPDRLEGEAYDDRNRSSYIDFVPNAVPSQGTWFTAPSGTSTNLNPTVSGTMPHPSEDSAYDTTRRFRLVVEAKDTDGNYSVFYSENLTPTPQELKAGRFTRTLPTLAGYTDHRIYFTHTDSWGETSPRSAYAEFKTPYAPSPPVAVTPAPPAPGSYEPRVTTLTPTYTVKHVDAASRSTKAVQFRVTDEDGAVLGETAWITRTVAANANTSQTANLPTLVWNGEWTYQARVRVTIGGTDYDSEWSDPGPFRTNFLVQSYKPQPTGGKVTLDRNTAVFLNDNDRVSHGDNVTTVQVELYDAGAPSAGTQILSANQQGVETNATGFTGTNTNISRSGAQFYAGSASLSATVPAANVEKDCFVSLDGLTCTPGRTVYWRTRVYCATSFYLDLSKFYIQHANGRVIARVTGKSVESFASGGWNVIEGTAEIPLDWNGAQPMRLVVRPPCSVDGTLYTTQTVYFDDFSVNVSAAPALVSGYPKTATIVSNTYATYEIPQADMTLGRYYQFRFRATDGLASGYGPWSPLGSILYASVPQSKMLLPFGAGDGLRRNVMKVPRAALATLDRTTYALGTQYLTESGRTATVYGEVASGEGPDGEDVWAFNTAAGVSGTNYYVETGKEAVDATRYAYPEISVKASGPNEDARCLVQVACYNGSGTLLSLVTPDSLRATSGVTLPHYWARYGGFLSPTGGTAPALPSGTTQVALRLYPLRATDTAQPQRILVDKLDLSQPPAGTSSVLTTASLRAGAQRWSGPRDGSSEDFAVDTVPDSDGYDRENSWEGEPGASASLVLPVVDGRLVASSTGYPLAISYSSPSSSAKTKHRVVVQYRTEDASGHAWAFGYDSRTVTSSSLTPTIPEDSMYGVPDGRRARIKAYVTDAAGVTGETEWVEFDVDFYPAPELEVRQARGIKENGTIALEYYPSDLASDDFHRVEVYVEGETEGRYLARVERSRLSTGLFVYRYPLSGDEYNFEVVQYRKRGGVVIASKPSRASASLDYTGLGYIKDVGRPGRNVPFAVLQATPPEDTRSPVEEYEVYPPDGGFPKQFVGTARIKDGAAQIYLNSGHGVRATVRERQDTLNAMLVDQPTICFMRSHPKDKHFAAIAGDGTFTARPEGGRLVEFPWQKTAYSEVPSERGEVM